MVKHINGIAASWMKPTARVFSSEAKQEFMECSFEVRCVLSFLFARSLFCFMSVFFLSWIPPHSVSVFLTPHFHPPHTPFFPFFALGLPLFPPIYRNSA